MEESYHPELISEETKLERRKSIPHLGVNETNDLTQSLLPDKMVRISLLSEPTYLRAWIDLNVGFVERYAKREGFRKKMKGFFRKAYRKEWQHVEKLCPPIKYPSFISNHRAVHIHNIKAWKEMDHKYLIKEVEKLPFKN